MRAVHVCQKLLSESLRKIDVRRLRALWFAVTSLLLGGRLTLTALGRSAKGQSFERYNIKRIDRLLGNRTLRREIPLIYRAIAGTLLRDNRRPLVVVDWTESGEGFHALTAGVPVGGKCIPIYAEVHPEKKLNSHRVHLGFLRELAKILPKEAVPVIVTDGGFKKGWFDEIVRRDWDFIGRVRGNTRVWDKASGAWKPLSWLYRLATSKAQDNGNWLLGKGDPRDRRVVTYFKPPRKRRQPKCWRRKPGQDKRRNHANNVSSNDKKYRKAAKEPWILATSLTCSPKEVVRLYRSRMQTEETYRGLKSHAYGWSLEDSRTKSASRLAILFLIGALAMLVASTLGCMAEWCGLHRYYQANTTRRRVLSWSYLGIRIGQRRDFRPKPHAIREGVARLAQAVISYAPMEA